MKSSNTSERLKQIMEMRNLRQVDILELTKPYCKEHNVKMNKSDLSQYVSGLVEPGQEKLAILGLALNVNEAWLMGYDVPMDKNSSTNIIPLTTKRVPLLGEIVAGIPKYADEHFQYYIDVEDGINADFCLKVKGDSMINARIYDGDIVFIREQPDVEDGEIAAVLIDDEATLKRVYKMPGRIQLRAENPNYEPINITEEEGKKIKILGKAVAFQSKVR